MTDHRQRARQPGHFLSQRWLILLALVGLVVSLLGCSLSRKLVGPRVLADGPQPLTLATRTPWPTFTPVVNPSPTPTPTFIPSATPMPTATTAPTNTPFPTPTPIGMFTPVRIPGPTATFTPLPTSTPWPTNTPALVPATATATPTPPPSPGYDYLVAEIYKEHTTNSFLTGYVAIVNAQEIPIGGVKAVGSFEPGGSRYESPLSKWIFEGYSAPGAVIKTSSVKFEPPGGVQTGIWFIHLEDEWGVRLSEDVPISIDPDNPEWFFVKFRQPGPPVAVASASTPTGPSSVAVTTASDGSATSTGGWSFVGVKSIYDPDEEGVFVHGEVMNGTGASQRISYIFGTFYDAQGQVIADRYDTDNYWPIDVVPPGGEVPFEMVLYDIQDVADFDLKVIAQPSNEKPRQDFEFSDVDTSNGSGGYCVSGRLRNPGGGLSDFLKVVAVLYNDQDDVINYDSYDLWYPEDVVGDQSGDFQVCVDALNQEVARHELRAWGQ